MDFAGTASPTPTSTLATTAYYSYLFLVSMDCCHWYCSSAVMIAIYQSFFEHCFRGKRQNCANFEFDLVSVGFGNRGRSFAALIVDSQTASSFSIPTCPQSSFYSCCLICCTAHLASLFWLFLRSILGLVRLVARTNQYEHKCSAAGRGWFAAGWRSIWP